MKLPIFLQFNSLTDNRRLQLIKPISSRRIADSPIEETR